MSKQNKEVDNSNKPMTKYDRKMQQRAEAQEKEKKSKTGETVIGIVILVAIVALVASFPIRNYLTVNGTYFYINDEKISKVEYDYYYNSVKNSYVSQYASIYSYYGIDLTGDLSTQMYSDTLSWKDVIEQATVENIKSQKAMKVAAEAAGFTHNTDEEYANFKASAAQYAKENGITEKQYLVNTYGEYATWSRLEKVIKNAIYVNAFYGAKQEELAPTDADITAYYEENSDTYDEVDFLLTTIVAELPTEPTELADPVDATAETTETTEDATYTPSEAEVAKAMADAKAKADEALKVIDSEGNSFDGYTKSNTSTYYADWLFDAERQAGDTTIVEVSASNRYYVVKFLKKYRDDEPTANFRILISESDPDTISAAWDLTDKSEDAFVNTLYGQFDSTGYDDGGRVTSVARGEMGSDELDDWLYDASRTKGDFASFQVSNYTYSIYYLETSGAAWYESIKSSLSSSRMTDYQKGLMENYTVKDPKKNLYYLTVEETTAE